jgi:hypothetical protein
MGMKDVKMAGENFEVMLRPAKNFISFINTNEGDILSLRQSFGKSLDTVTDEDVINYAGISLSQETIDNSKSLLTVLEKLITIVKPIRDELPANDIEG